MKKIMMWALLVAMAFMVTACNDDDGGENTTTTVTVYKQSPQAQAIQASFDDWSAREVFPVGGSGDNSDEEVLAICQEIDEAWVFEHDPEYDYWQTSQETLDRGMVGDLEDRAIFAYNRMLEIGVPTLEVKILIAETADGSRAYILAVRDKVYFLPKDKMSHFKVAYRFGETSFVILEKYGDLRGYTWGGV